MNFDFLIEMAWKSAMIGGAALLIAALLKRRSAGERSAVLRTAVVIILLLPLISIFLPALPVVTSTVYETARPLSAIAAEVPLTAAAAAEPGMWDDPTPLIELAWLGGVVMVLLRLWIGLATLSRWTRSGSPVTHPEWRAAFARALDASRCVRPVQLLVSDAPSPMSWGWLKPVILLDRDSFRDPGEADAVLAHELAHVVRRDWAILILARLVAALFWFNPLMWLLERRLVAEAEEAADARALEHVEPGRYAQTLLSCAQQYFTLTVPAAGMADAGLTRRVRAIVDRRLRAGAPHPKWIRAAVALCATIALPIAALKPVEAVVRADLPQAPQAPLAPRAPAAPRLAAIAPVAPLAPSPIAQLAGVGGVAIAPEAPIAPEPPEPMLAPQAPAAPRAPAAPAPTAAPQPPRDAYWSRDDEREIERTVNAAMADAASVRAEALRDAGRARAEAQRDAERARSDALRQAASARVEARRASQLARLEVRRGLAQGADGMESGARGMDEGAAQMDRQAERLRSQSYRQEEIAKAAREGRTVTHEELIAMIPKLHGGADGMRRGAEKMRRSAERMRTGHSD